MAEIEELSPAGAAGPVSIRAPEDEIDDDEDEDVSIILNTYFSCLLGLKITRIFPPRDSVDL